MLISRTYAGLKRCYKDREGKLEQSPNLEEQIHDFEGAVVDEDVEAAVELPFSNIEPRDEPEIDLCKCTELIAVPGAVQRLKD